MGTRATERGRAGVLVIEDDAAINDVVRRKLSKEGFQVTCAFSGSEAHMLLDSAPEGQFAAIITDLMLPGLSGEELVRLIRAKDARVPILVISAKTAAVDKVALLKMGADDYLAKPFDLDELTARVQALLRRSGISAADTEDPSAKDVISVGPVRMQPEAREATVNRQPLQLTRTEFDMLALMAAHPGRVFTKQELYEHAWGEPYAAQESTVAAHISNLRSKLKPHGADGLIQTVWGIGFKLS